MAKITLSQDAMIWFSSKTEYDMYVKICNNNEQIPPYDKWKAYAENKFLQARITGKEIIKVHPRFVDFTRWYKANASASDKLKMAKFLMNIV